MEQSKIDQIEKLYIELYPSLYRYAQYCLHSDSLAEEAVQEAFGIACAKPDELLRCEKPLGWLMVAVRNVSRNIHRRQESDKKLLLECFSTFDLWKDGREDVESLDLLYGPLAKTAEYKLIKSLAIDGKSVKEIADEQGITLEACYKRIQRAREFLKKKVK